MLFELSLTSCCTSSVLNHCIRRKRIKTIRYTNYIVKKPSPHIFNSFVSNFRSTNKPKKCLFYYQSVLFFIRKELTNLCRPLCEKNLIQNVSWGCRKANCRNSKTRSLLPHRNSYHLSHHQWRHLLLIIAVNLSNNWLKFSWTRSSNN